MITWPALADAVRLCAARPAAAVHVVGRPGGVIRLRGGAVVGTWTTGTPLAVPSPDRASRSQAATAGPLARLAMTDAVFVMAAGRVNAWRTDDDPTPASTAASMDLEELLHEVDRRIRRVFGPDGVLPPEETVVRRLDRSGSAPGLSPTPQESRLLEVLEGTATGPDRRGEGRGEGIGRHGGGEWHGGGVSTGRTVRDLAFALGRGVFGVLLDAQRLAAMGAVALSAQPFHDDPEPGLLVRARRDLDGMTVAAVSAALRRRRVELSGEQPVVPEPPPVAAVPGTLTRRVPGATGADRPRRRAPWQPRRMPNEIDEQ